MWEATENAASLPNKNSYLFIKRGFDIISSFFALIILSPIFIILIIIVKCTSKGPAFYIHKRVGKGGKEIGIIKFRSMVTNADELIKSFSTEQKKEYHQNYKLENDPRITKIGNFLRKTSLDELPQLFNILKGELSVVGPRPVMEKETEIFGDDKQLLLSVKPGLTGWWAANGRSDTSYKERVEMEIYYVKNRSALLDIKVIIKTFSSVFKGEGAR